MFLALSLSLAVTSALIVVALVYLRGWLALRSTFPKLIPGWRLASFMSGIVITWIGIASPLATLDHQLLTIHMLKHLLLMTVAAPLILVGAPVATLVSAFPKLFINSYPPLASLAARWLGSRLRNSAMCWLAGTAAVTVWHIPGPFQSGMRFPWVHVLEDVSFLLAGLLFWWPIFWRPIMRPSPATKAPRWSMALYLFLATLPCDILSAFLVFCNRPVYPFYLSTTHLFGMAPLQDQECAGALMWIWVTFAYMIPAVVITVRSLTPPTIQSHGMRDAVEDERSGRLNDAEVC